MKELNPVLDGDQGPIIRFTLNDVSGARDMSTAAVEVYIEDNNRNLLGIRPGVIVSKTDATLKGKVDVLLKGKETDWDGLGKDIVLVPKIYYAQAMDGVTPATNLLLNPSFDTDTNADGIPDSWGLQGTKTATWSIGTDDPAPPVISVARLLTKHATTSEPDYIQQALTPTVAAGDVFSVGCWHRSSGGAGEAQNDNHAIFFRLGSNSNSFVRFRVGENDWYFSIGSVTADQAYSSAVMGILAGGTTLSNRFDDAFAFMGRWAAFLGERKRLPVKPVGRPPKSTNILAGFGGFEQDTNADGLADAFSNQASGVVFSIEKNPANVYEGLASQKCILTNQSGKLIRIIARGKFRNLETWQLSVKQKTVGALTSGGGTGGFSLGLSSAPFDGMAQSATFGLLADTSGAFVTRSVSIGLTADRNELYCDINLNGYTGTMYLDDLQLVRTVAAP